jgi:hypothetical protein
MPAKEVSVRNVMLNHVQWSKAPILQPGRGQDDRGRTRVRLLSAHVRGVGKIEIAQTDRQAHLGKDCCDANHDGKMDSRIAAIFYTLQASVRKTKQLE